LSNKLNKNIVKSVKDMIKLINLKNISYLMDNKLNSTTMKKMQVKYYLILKKLD
jgi:hypothetical protein